VITLLKSYSDRAPRRGKAMSAISRLDIRSGIVD
jgi:hypothetical protein